MKSFAVLAVVVAAAYFALVVERPGHCNDAPPDSCGWTPPPVEVQRQYAADGPVTLREVAPHLFDGDDK
ncbi:MAG: hypothetical protein JSS27_01050 [Planctomycetes bacterium]|nr:hypothetical protein [Planctomycetota bacterium]